MSRTSAYLGSYLEPLVPFLNGDAITDIFINRPGEVITESLDGEIRTHEVPDLTEMALQRLARQVAALNAQGISRQHPLLAGVLPDGSRIQIVLPPATRGEIAIAIRRHVSASLRLDDYLGAIEPASSTSTIEEANNDNLAFDPVVTLEALRAAVRQRRTILISGGTSTGKTTFLNALIGEIPETERLIFIEDTPELRLNHSNTIGLLAVRGSQGEAEVSAEDLLIASLRMRPDRIILGELRGKEALTYLRAVNTGHPGSITTIHADSPERAIDQLALLLLQGGANIAWDAIIRQIRDAIDLVVQLQRQDGRRVISQVLSLR